MTGSHLVHPVAAAHPSEHDFALAAPGSVLLAHRDRLLPSTPATDSTADDVLARLRKLTRETAGRRRPPGRTGRPVVCGMIPFDPEEPADLFITEQPVWVPRPCPSGPVGLVPELVAGPLSRDPEYREAVAEALDRIGRGAAEHLVLARTLDLGHPRPVDARALWERLLTDHPEDFAYSLRPLHGDHLLGTGPQLTAELGPTGFTSHLFTGVTPRRPSVAGDAAAQQALLHDPAARRFHHHALDHAQRALQGLITSLTVPDRPSAVATGATWHLATRLTGRLRRDTSALHTALALHRGPAAGGTPTDAALSLIRELEPCRRGPSAGLIGWTDAAGHGQWVPVVRCALLHQARARLYTAAHLSTESTVEEAHREMTAMFGTLRAALAAAQARPVETALGDTPWLPEAA